MIPYNMRSLQFQSNDIDKYCACQNALKQLNPLGMKTDKFEQKITKKQRYALHIRNYPRKTVLTHAQYLELLKTVENNKNQSNNGSSSTQSLC